MSKTKNKLKSLIKGLTYQSETSAPFKVLTRKSIPLSVFYTLGFKNFFQNLTEVKGWFSDEEIALSAKFAELQDFFDVYCEYSNVIKVRKSETEFEIWIYGITKSDEILGVKTISVET